MKLGTSVRWGSISFCLGVLAGSIFFQFPKYFLFAAIVFCIAAIFFTVRSSNPVLFLISLVFFCCGFWYVNLKLSQAMIVVPMNVKTVFRGVVNFVSISERSQSLKVRVSEPVDFRFKQIFMYTNVYPEYHYGDVIEFSCSSRQTVVDTLQSKIYRAKNGAVATCYYPTIRKRISKQTFFSSFFQLKNAYSVVLNQALHEPEGVLARAMLIGEQTAIPKALTADFAAAGITHLIAISGMNITIIIFMFDFVLLAFAVPRGARVLINTAMIAFYILILGFPSSAVRAALMGLAVLYARISGRAANVFHILILTAALMIVANPLIAAFDLGFQLSFCAMAGLLVTYEWWSRVLWFIPETLGMRTIAATTMSAQVFTVPLVIFDFKIFSVIAPIANLFVVPTLPFIMILSMIIFPLSFFGSAAEIAVWPLYFILKWVTVVARAFASMSWSWFAVSDSMASIIVMLYCGAITTIALLYFKEKQKKTHARIE